MKKLLLFLTIIFAQNKIFFSLLVGNDLTGFIVG